MTFLILVIFFFAISSGIFCSSISFVERKAVEAAIGLVLLIVAGWPAAAMVIAEAREQRDLGEVIVSASPLGAWWGALDAQYRASPVGYWPPLSLPVEMALLLLAAATRATARVWVDR